MHFGLVFAILGQFFQQVDLWPGLVCGRKKAEVEKRAKGVLLCQRQMTSIAHWQRARATLTASKHTSRRLTINLGSLLIPFLLLAFLCAISRSAGQTNGRLDAATRRGRLWRPFMSRRSCLAVVAFQFLNTFCRFISQPAARVWRAAWAIVIGAALPAIWPPSTSSATPSG